MRKKLIKKGEYAIPGGITNNTINWSDPNIYNQLMKSVGMDFSQPSTFSAGLFNPKISASNNLPLPKANMENVLSSSGLGVPQSPDINKITTEGVTKLNSMSAPTDSQMKSAQNKQKWGDFKSNMKEFGSSDLGKGMIDLGVNAGLDLGLTALGKESDALDGGVNAIADVAGNLDYVVPGLGTGVKYGLKALNFADKALGKTTKSFAGNTGLSGYQDFSTQGKQFRVSQTGARRRSEIETLGNKKMFTTAKTNADALLKKQQASIQASGNTGITNQSQLLGGQNYSVLTAKKGATLQDIRNYIKVRNIEKEVVQNPNLDDNLEKIEVSKFQNGGSLIPSGALHKNKHKIESVNSELDGEITKKGIPVISYAEKGDVLEFENDGKTPKVLAEGGEVIQHAEIEVGEIILNISLTKKLIELMNKGTNDDMIHAGKLLAKEIMENTTDNTDIMEKMIDKENA